MKFIPTNFLSRKNDVNRPVSILAIALFSALGPYVFQVMPVYISAAATAFSLTESQVGRLAAADLFGILASSLLMRLIVQRINWRLILISASGVVVITNLFCVSTEAYGPLIVLRFGAGLGAGAVLSLVMASVGQTRQPDRNVAIAIATQVALASIGLVGLPYLIDVFGLSSVYLLFAILTVLPLPLVCQLPTSAGPKLSKQDRNQEESSPNAWLALIASSIFFLGQGAFWGYIGQVGASAGLSAAYVSKVLGLGAIVGFVSALLASWLGHRYGRIKPIGISSFAMCVAVLLLGGKPDEIMFLLACQVYLFFWHFSIAFQVGIIVTVDHAGKAAVSIPAFQAIGLASGPLIGSFIVGADNFSQLYSLILIAIVISFILFLIVVKRATPLKNGAVCR